MSKPTPTRVLLSHTLAAMAKRVFVAFLVLVTLTSVYSITRANVPVANAAAPTTLNFQARLLNSSGSLVNDGTYNVEFKIYNASTSSGSSQGACTGDANCLWTETRTGANKVQVKNGYLSAYLGDISALPTNIWNQQLYLTMNIGGTGAASWDGEMTPRIRLTSVPYAFRATIAESAETLSKNTGTNTGTVEFATMTADRKFLFPDTSLATTASPGTICVYNGAASNCPAASGSAYYLQNDTVLQTQTNFHIQARDSGANGTIGGVITGAANGQTVDLLQFRASNDTTVLAAVTAAGNLQVASSVDTRVAGTLSVGTSTATAVSIGKSGAATTINGQLAVTEAFSANGGATVTGATNINTTGTAITTIGNSGAGVVLNGAVTVNGVAAFNQNVVVAAEKTIRFVGGTTAQRPASPSEGELYFDTTTKQLLAYANGKWQTDHSTATKIVAASNSSQAVKDSADYVADGTGDQVEINAALTAAAGGKVYLTEGTFVANATILIPNNTVLVGSGRGTLIELADLDISEVLIENSDITTGTGVRIQDLRLDGRNDLNTAGTQHGIYFNGMGGGAGSTARSGGTISGVTGNNFRGYAVYLFSSSNNTLSNNRTQGNSTGGFAIDVGSHYTTFTGNIVQGSAYGAVIASNGNTITGNTFQGHTNTGIYLFNAHNNAVTGNSVTGNGSTGIYLLNTSSSNVVSGNKVHDNGGLTTNNGIYVQNADSNNISGNSFSDSSATATNFAIHIIDNTSDTNYLSGNTLGGASINDLGTGTIYGGQVNGSGNFVIQPTGTIELLKNTNVTGTLDITSNVDANGSLTVGNANQFVISNIGVITSGTWNGTALTDTYVADALTINSSGSVDWTALTGYPGACAAGSAVTQIADTLTCTAFATGTAGSYIQNQNASAQSTSNFWISSTGRADTSFLAPTFDVGTAAALNIGTTNATSLSVSKSGVTTTVNGALTVTQAGTFNGGLSVASDFTVTSAGNVAFQRKTTDFTTTGTSNDVNLGTGVLFRLNGVTAQTITSITGGTDGRVITLVNAAANAATIQNDTGGTVANRIITGTGGDLSVPSGASIQLAYDSAASRWRVIGGSAVAGGGANQQLSNLTNTNINTALNATANNLTLQTTTSGNIILNSAGNIQLQDDTSVTGTLSASIATQAPLFDTATAVALGIGTTNATNISIGHNAGTLAIDQTNFDLATNGVITLAGGQTADITTQANQNLTVLANGTGTIVLNDTITAAGTLTFSNVATDITTGTNEDLTIDANGSGLLQLSDSIVVAANQYLKLAGGNIASRPGSPTEGMLYYDTETDQLLIYNGSKWQADGREAVLVAANDSSPAAKAAADYIADGTGDQAEIISAITEATTSTGNNLGSYKVYLFAGTYTIADTISLPNNVTLSGAGKGTLLQFANLGGISKNMITNTTTGNLGTGITIHDLKLDGNKVTNSTGTFTGIYLDGIGSPTTNLAGATINNVTIQNFESHGINIVNSANNIVTGNTIQTNDNHGILTNGANHDIITGNTITGNTLNGIYFNATARDLVSGNFVGSNGSHGIRIETGNTNTITDNILRSNTGSGSNSSITLVNTDTNQITNNNITDTAGTGYAIDISDAGSDANYLSNNTYSGTGASSIQDLSDATGGYTIYAGQTSSSGNYLIQPAGTIELMKNTNVTGTLTASVALYSPILDTATAVALGIGTSNATNISLGHNAGTLAIDQTNFDLSTAGVITLAGGQVADITTQANQNLTVTANGTGTIVLNDNVSATGYVRINNSTSSNPLSINTVTTSNTASTSAQLLVSTNGTTNNGIVVQTVASQVLTSNPILVQNNAGNQIFGVDGQGNITMQNSTGSIVRTFDQSGASTNSAALTVRTGNSSTSGDTGAVTVKSGDATSGNSGAITIDSGSASGTTGAINIGTANSSSILFGKSSGQTIRIGQNGGTLQLDGTNFDLATTGVITLAGGQAADITTQANQNLTIQANGTGVVNLNDAVSVSGDFTVANTGNVAFQNGATADFTTGGTLTDFAIGTGTLFRFDGASAQTISSIAGGADGRTVTLINASSSFAITVQNDTGGTASNRIITGTGGNLSVPIGATIQLAYDSDSSRWRVIGGTATSGGGANQQLSNLSGTVAVNAALTPNTDNTLDLGSSSNSWRTLYADTSVLTPTIDTSSATTLGIGTITANAISVSRTGITTTVNGALTVTQAGQFNGGLTVASNLTVTNAGNVAFQRNTTDITAIGTQNDFALPGTGTGALFRITSASALNLTSITGGADGRLITLINASANDVTIQNDSGGTAANRIITGTGANVVVPAGASVTLAYDSSSSRWRVIGSTAAANGYIQLQSSTPGTAQTGNFNINGTGIAATSLLTPTLDTPSGTTTLNIGTTNASAGINLNQNTQITGNLTLAQGANRQVSVAARSTAGAGYDLTVAAGAANGANNAGGGLLLQGGAAVAGNANGGAVIISGGAGFGTGSQGLVNLSTTAFTSAAVQTYTVTGVNSIAAGLVDQFSTIPVLASTNTGIIVSVPDPAQATAIGRVLYISARDGSLDFTLRLNASGTPIDIAMKKNSTATLIWNGDEWTAAGASSSTDLQSAYNNTLTSAGGAEIVLNPSGGAADGFTIRNNATTPISGGILEVQSAVGTNLFSVNNRGTELATNGGAETSSTFTTNWTAASAGGTITRHTTAGQYATGQAGVQAATTGVDQGVRNNLASNPAVSTTFTVSFTVKASVAISSNNLNVQYSRDGGTDLEACTSYSSQNVSISIWTKITCTITTDSTIATNPDLIIRQGDATSRNIWIDNLSFIQNDSSTEPSNVQIGGGVNGGPVTLFTLDRATAPPVANGNQTYYGSMYYDTTTGSIQCYEADGWGACGSPPDNIITLTPEYTGAVLNGNGIGVMTADLCANQATVLVVGTLCASGEARNFYRWTSPQATLQDYSIYVSYKLPTTFKEFTDNNTMKLTAYRDDVDNTDALVKMTTYRKNSAGGLTLCGSETNITQSSGSWEQRSVTGSENSCSFTGGDYIIFKITMSSRNNTNVYVENLDFTYINK